MQLMRPLVTKRRSCFSSWRQAGVWACCLFLWCAQSLPAQDAAETRAFRKAAQAFQDKLYERTEREFEQFIVAYPASPLLPDAILLQGRAALERTNLTRAITLLENRIANAGLLADQYRYYIGLAHLQSTNYRAAAQSFAALARDFTNSVFLLEASHGEALARFKLDEFPRVVALLQDPQGAFQRAAKDRSADILTMRGTLLLSQALFAQRKYREAEQILLTMKEAPLTPDFRWERGQLLCLLLMADRRPVEALAATTNLIALARATAQPGRVADSFAIQGNILEQLNLNEAAIQCYTNNLADTVPQERRKLAQMRIVQIKLDQEKVSEASRLLEAFLARHPEDAASDAVLLTVGELQLRLHLGGSDTNATNVVTQPVPTTNHLQQALGQFEKFLVTFTNSPLRGQAHLNKGWCLWLDGKFADSGIAFKAATETLPYSEDLALARFKLADAQFTTGDLTNAVQNYRAVTNEFAALPRVRATLFDHALYQIVRASLDLKDLEGAQDAMRKIVAWYPDSPFSDSSLLLVGQGLLDQRQPSDALALFTSFAATFPSSVLLPQVLMAEARTYLQEAQWPSAIQTYEEWLRQFPTNDLRPRAEFDLAWANWRAGLETNAFTLFTNFIATFPTNELAPRAQYWVGDYHMRQADYVNAQSSYQRIIESTNWPTTRLTYQARFAAGRAAFERQGWKEAGGERGHFTLLVNDVEHCPPDLAAEALFALGDTYIRQGDYSEARKVFTKIPPFATNQLARRLVPLAFGKIGDCSLQLAGQDPKQYEVATNAYLRVMTNELAEFSTRCLAEYGLARSLELQAGGRLAVEARPWLNAAFDHYYNIVINDQEPPDPFWLKEAGFAAARLAEDQKQWPVVIAIYERLRDVLTPLRPKLQDRIDKAREQLVLEKN